MEYILQIAAKLYIGGAEKVARDIALSANPEKYEFHYLVFGEEVGAYEHQLLEKGCKVFHLAEPSDSYQRYIKALMALMKQYRYHAVHVHTMFSSGWVMLAAKLCGVPVRVAHAHSALDDGKSLVKSIYEAVMRFLILSCATDLVACGVKAGRRLYGPLAYEKRGQLVLNGIDIPAFAYCEEKRETIRKQLNAEDAFILGHAGHLVDVKNQSFLLDLMPLVLEKKPNAHLLLLGEGVDRPMLEQKIREMKLQNHVIMTGNVTNVADYLSAMDVFVFPSLYEGLPLSILEVQANGLPCVISDRVPEDVFLTDLIHPLSLEDSKEMWLEKILSVKRSQPQTYHDSLKDSEYAVETAMEKIYRIYEKGKTND
jgi:glycosyltransferase involved in cell wall biosynthesis